MEAEEGSPAKAQALLDLERLPQAGRAARRATELHPGQRPGLAARWRGGTGLAGTIATDSGDAGCSAKVAQNSGAEELQKSRPTEAGKTMSGTGRMTTQILVAMRRLRRMAARPGLVLAGALLLGQDGVSGAAPAPAGASKPGAELVGDPGLLMENQTLTVSFCGGDGSGFRRNRCGGQEEPDRFRPENCADILFGRARRKVSYHLFGGAARHEIPRRCWRRGLVDLAGNPVKAGKAGEPLGMRSSEEFTVGSTSSRIRSITARPAVVLTFSVKIKPADLAETTWFQDRDSRKRYPAEVIVQPEDQEEAAILVAQTRRSPRAGSAGRPHSSIFWWMG